MTDAPVSGSMPAGPALLSIRDLVVRYPARRGAGNVPAVDGVSIDIAPGETVGLVGESGSGKTTIGRAVLGLAPASGGSIVFDGRDITHVGSKERRALTNDIQVVFQDPFGSMNPTHTVGQILGEPLRNGMSRTTDPLQRVAEMLQRVGLPPSAAQRYPSQFSGGQRQRIAIARALMLSPRLVICDEPVSALDLSVQAQILNLFRQLQDDLGVAYLFIAHDLDVVRHLSDRITVLYRGQVMESGVASDVHGSPRHPYARALHDAAPVPDPAIQARRRASRIAASAPVPDGLLHLGFNSVPPSHHSAAPVPDGLLHDQSNGCVFASRCSMAIDVCRSDRPALLAPVDSGSLVACHRRDEKILPEPMMALESREFG
jgi:ABC-type glutathione transport system ATPase component